MKESISCPNCGTSFSVARENEGKRAKCAKCQQSFTIQFAESQPKVTDILDVSHEPNRTSPTVATIVSPPDLPTPKFTVTKRAASKSVTIPQWAVIAGPAILTLVAGYFIGREHVKYQIRSSFENAAEAFSKAFQKGPLGANQAAGSSKIESSVSKDSPSASSGADPSVEKPSSREVPLPTSKPRQFQLGESAQGKGFTIALKDARIEAPVVKDIMGQDAKGKDRVLILSFDFANTDDRRILRFKEDNPFMGSHFKLRDDVDNGIRGVRYGIGAKPKGALTSADDIAPGATASHVEFFAVPPPKTEFLILTIDLACLGGEGDVEFKISANAISQ